MMVHDLMARAKVFEHSKTAKEDKVLFDEIYQLNEERLRKDEDDLEDYMTPDPKRRLSRLAEYSDKIHSLFVQLDFKTLFEHYHKAHQERCKISQALALELSDIGLISQNHVNEKA